AEYWPGPFIFIAPHTEYVRCNNLPVIRGIARLSSEDKMKTLSMRRAMLTMVMVAMIMRIMATALPGGAHRRLNRHLARLFENKRERHLHTFRYRPGKSYPHDELAARRERNAAARRHREISKAAHFHYHVFHRHDVDFHRLGHRRPRVKQPVSPLAAICDG